MILAKSLYFLLFLERICEITRANNPRKVSLLISLLKHAVADPDQAFGGGSQIGGRLKCLHLLKYQRLSATKEVFFCKSKVAIFVGRTMLFFRE